MAPELCYWFAEAVESISRSRSIGGTLGSGMYSFLLDRRVMVPRSLYRRILGARFDELPEVLRRFHGTPGGGRARGTLQVKRAGGPLRNGLASLLGLPRTGTDVSVRLEVEIEGDRERWVRNFQGQRLETVQWARGDLLMESYGPTTFSSALVVEGSCLCYEFRRASSVRPPRGRPGGCG
jgi:hypothetical protein